MYILNGTVGQQPASGINQKTARKGRVSIKIGAENNIKYPFKKSARTITKHLRKVNLRANKFSEDNHS